jgi:hypothetical protein
MPTIVYVGHFTENVTLNFDVDYTLETVDGNRFLIPTNPRATVNLSRIYFHVTNLFGKQPMLSKFINTKCT